MRGRSVVVVLAGAVALAGAAAWWSGTGSRGWPQEMRDAFLQSCATSSGARKAADVKHYCECTLERLETSMTLEEYRREEAVMTTGGFKPTPRMAEIILGCIGVDHAAAAADPALSWTADEQRQFLVGCIPAARSSLGADEHAADKATRYCRCALAEAAKRMTAEEYRTLERAALPGTTAPASGPLRDIAAACAAVP